MGSLFLLIIATLILNCETDPFVDHVCKLPVDPGKKCPDSKPGEAKMYHFDPSKEKCVHFTYLGCEGNQNKFGGSDDCINACQTPYFVINNKKEDKRNAGVEPHKKSDCALAPIQGPCRAFITMWYYNGSTSACDMFGYGGCEGNTNKFDSRNDCESFCGDNTIKTKKP